MARESRTGRAGGLRAEAFVVVMAGRWEEPQVSGRATLKTPLGRRDAGECGSGAAGWPVDLLLRQGAFYRMGRWVPSKNRDLDPAKHEFPSGRFQQTKHGRNGQRWATRAGDEAEAAGTRILKNGKLRRK